MQSVKYFVNLVSLTDMEIQLDNEYGQLKSLQ